MEKLLFLALLLTAVPLLADITLSDCESPNNWTGPVTRDTEHVKSGAASLRWEFGKTRTITLKNVPSDWTSHNAIAFWVHNGVPRIHRPWIVVRGSQSNDHWSIVTLRIDFTGWRRFVVPFKEFDQRRGTKKPDWDKIESLAFDASTPGWRIGLAPEDTVLCIDDIRLTTVKHPAPGEGPRMTDAQFFDALDLDRPELAEVKAAVEKGDTAGAKRAFAAHLRARRHPRWFDMWWERPAPDPKHNTKKADRVTAGELRMGAITYRPEDRIDWWYNPPIYSDGPKKTKEYNAALNRFYHFRELNGAYWHTGKDAYAEVIVKQITAWIEDCPVPLCQSGDSPYIPPWQTLSTAARVVHYWMNAIFRTLDRPAWTDEAVVKMAKSMHEQAEHLMRFHRHSSNWLSSQARAMYCLGVLFPEFKRAPAWREKGCRLLHKQIETEVYPDGLQFELAVGYNTSVLRNFEAIPELAKLNGLLDDVPADYLQRMEKMYDYLLYVRMPNGNVPGRNDAYERSALEQYEQAVKFFPQRADFRWAATKGDEGKAPPPDSTAFDYCGHYALRTGWEPKDLYLHFDAGPFGAGHQHEDKLGFTLYAYGRNLIVEAGVHQYDDSPQRKYVLSTRAHNTVRVDGLDQHSYHVQSSWIRPYPFRPIGNPWIAGPGFDFVEGRYEHGYGTRKSRKVQVDAAHTRSILFVKPHYWIVTDTMAPKDEKEHRYESLFHLNADKAVADGPAAHTQNKDANIHIQAAPAAGLTARIVEGQEEPELQGWRQKNFTTLKPIPTAVYEWRATGTTQVTYVLYPTPKDTDCPIREIRPLKVEHDGAPAPGAVAAEIRFADGSQHLYFYAPANIGKCTFADCTTDARCALVKLDKEGKVVGAWWGFGTTLTRNGQALVKDQ